MESSRISYDFIIVGAGPAGCCVARSLANSEARPQVLLLEAGGDSSDINQRIIGNQFVQFLNPDQVFPYESTPQPHLDGRKIGLTRGKGLGGSSCVNFTAWNSGARDDYDGMAQLTGDSAWKWKNVLRRFKQLETFHDKQSEVPAGMAKYLSPSPDDHGYNGPLHIGFENKWDHYTTSVMDAWEANGFAINRDLGNGEHLGIAIVPKTMHRGTRATAADLLNHAPSNLHIVTDAHVHRVEMEGGRATNVRLLDGRQFRASKEIVLSAGSLDSPRILMHSGIGPAAQLNQFGIGPVIVDNPGVGQKLRDHYHIAMKYARAEHTDVTSAFFRDKTRQAAAMREWQLFRTGDYVTAGTSMVMGFFKNDAVLRSSEFASLPEAEKKRLQQPTIPTYEVAALGISPEYYTTPETTPPLVSILVFVHNSQGLGSVSLQSSDPAVPLVFKPSFADHPYDKKVMIESTRETMNVLKSKEFLEHAHPSKSAWDAPASDSDEDILDFWAKNCTSTWHMSSTCEMGRSKDEGAVVDNRFRVFGVRGLRVVDMSVMPIIASCHVQSTAYQVGMIAAEKLVAEHRLNGQQRL